MLPAYETLVRSAPIRDERDWLTYRDALARAGHQPGRAAQGTEIRREGYRIRQLPACDWLDVAGSRTRAMVLEHIGARAEAALGEYRAALVRARLPAVGCRRQGKAMLLLYLFR